ncbi:cation-transporting P-type ATPase [Desulfonatronum thioautotrophicum]|nr:cation-transporting P-type ATPase [Desulfonatronum thioautotrophicum]
MEKNKLRDTAWHTTSPDDVLKKLESEKEKGLSGDEAKKRLERY